MYDHLQTNKHCLEPYNQKHVLGWKTCHQSLRHNIDRQTGKQTDRQRDQPSILCGSKLEQSVSVPAATKRKTAALMWWSFCFAPALSEDMTATANTQHVDVSTEINIHTPRQLTKKNYMWLHTESDRYIYSIIQKFEIKWILDHSQSQKRKKEEKETFRKFSFNIIIYFFITDTVSWTHFYFLRTN